MGYEINLRESRVEIILKDGEILPALMSGEDFPPSISVGAILDFCNGCDHQEGIFPDCTVGLNYQATYTKRGSCSWAQVDGKQGTMTPSGFESFKAE